MNVRCAKGPIAMASSASSHGMNVVVELIKGFINPRSVYAAFQKSWTARHQLTKVKVSGLAFPEGPRWHDGKLWFSDMHSLSVLTMEADGTLETVCRVENCPSGLGWLPDGRLLVVSMKDKRVLRREHSGELVEHASLSRASPRSRPTTWWSTRKGRAYVGHFGFDIEPPGGNFQFKAASLIRVDPDGKVATAAEPLAFPNGAVITPDGKTLIVGETYGCRLTAFTLGANGELTERRVWAKAAARHDPGRHLPRSAGRRVGGQLAVTRVHPRPRGREGDGLRQAHARRLRVRVGRGGRAHAVRLHREGLQFGKLREEQAGLHRGGSRRARGVSEPALKNLHTCVAGLLPVESGGP